MMMNTIIMLLHKTAIPLKPRKSLELVLTHNWLPSLPWQPLIEQEWLTKQSQTITTGN